MASESTPLIPSGVTPPSDASDDKPTVYFLERRDSNVSHSHASVNTPSILAREVEETETIPEGSTTEQFKPRPVSVAASVVSNGSRGGGGSPRHQSAAGGEWFNNFFKNVGKKSHPFAPSSSGHTPSGGIDSSSFPRSAPVKIDPKVFFANERTFLAWMHVAVILAGASVAITAFTDSAKHSGPNQLYGVILLPVSVSFILYAMVQCECFIDISWPKR